jgi:nucleotide-binding universal stress UspA family protein
MTNHFSRILCPVDFSPTSARALARAASLARTYGAALSILHVIPVFDPSRPVLESPLGLEEPGRVFYPASRETVVAELRSWAAAPAVVAVSPAFVAEEGRPADVIVAQAAESGADLLVLGTHGRTGFRRLLLGSVAETVLRTAPCPVLTVPPPDVDGADPAAPFMRVLCAVDFSSASLAALDLALAVAGQSHGCVTVLHVIERIDDGDPADARDEDLARDAARAAARGRERLHQVVRDRGLLPCEAEEVVAVNRAYREILQRAEALRADLIVMGAQGQGGLSLMLFGSNTQHVVRAAACPVLTVRAVESPGRAGAGPHEG